ncbi:MAG TPA: hypothetical protein VNO70_11460 [Blastocatellia bacterium]|nr:hypothetical protein [Blastocatellia bacterium]
MIARLCLIFICAMTLAAAPGGCMQSANVFRQENNPANLQALCQEIHKAIFVTKDMEKAATLWRSLLPDEERAKKALREDIPAEPLQTILAFHKKLLDAPLTSETLPSLAKPEQTEVRVSSFTTEEMAADSPAKPYLRPGFTFYSVEFLEKDKNAGMRYHLFYWDGRQWTMLGPIWRAFR